MSQQATTLQSVPAAPPAPVTQTLAGLPAPQPPAVVTQYSAVTNAVAEPAFNKVSTRQL